MMGALLSERVAAVVLAGGRSSRMGIDKAFLRLGGEPLVQRAARRLQMQVEHVAINANEDPQRFAGLDLPVVGDRFQGFQGPLAGFDVGMRWARDVSPAITHLLTVAVDTPFFPPDLLSRLMGAVIDAPEAIAIPGTGTGLHRVFALLPLSLADDLQAYLESGGARVRDWLTRHDTRVVDFLSLPGEGSDLNPFFNINTPEDLERAEAWFAATGQ